MISGARCDLRCPPPGTAAACTRTRPTCNPQKPLLPIPVHTVRYLPCPSPPSRHGGSVHPHPAHGASHAHAAPKRALKRNSHIISAVMANVAAWSALVGWWGSV